MKKIILALLVCSVVGVSTGFAAPINNLDKGQTAVGFVRGDIYAEHKLTDNFTIGLQDDDIYGQFSLKGNYRAIVGSRDYHGSHIYGGLAVITSLAPALDGYASVVASSSFVEAQVGANYNIARNVDLNANYSSFRPDEGRNKNRFGLGATFKF